MRYIVSVMLFFILFVCHLPATTNFLSMTDEHVSHDFKWGVSEWLSSIEGDAIKERMESILYRQFYIMEWQPTEHEKELFNHIAEWHCRFFLSDTKMLWRAGNVIQQPLEYPSIPENFSIDGISYTEIKKTAYFFELKTKSSKSLSSRYAVVLHRMPSELNNKNNISFASSYGFAVYINQGTGKVSLYPKDNSVLFANRIYSFPLLPPSWSKYHLSVFSKTK